MIEIGNPLSSYKGTCTYNANEYTCQSKMEVELTLITREKVMKSMRIEAEVNA